MEPNHCVDDALMIRRACDDKELMEFLKAAKQRSRGRTSLFPARSASSTIGAA